MAESVLGLLFDIGADPSKGILAAEEFRDRATQALREFEDQIMAVMTKSLGITKEFAIGMGVATGAVAGLGIAMFELANKAAETGEKIYEAAEKTGMSAEALSGINAVAKMTGGSFEGLSMALSRASVNLGKAMQDPAHGTGAVLAEVMGSAKALTDLGLLPMEDRMQTLLHRIFEINDVSERNRDLQALMGRGWMQNVATLKFLAEEGFGPAIEKAKEFGVFYDSVAAGKAKAFRIELAETEARLSGVAQMLGQKLLPVISDVIQTWSVWLEYISKEGPWKAVVKWSYDAANSVAYMVDSIASYIPVVGKYYEKRAEGAAAALLSNEGDKAWNDILKEQEDLIKRITTLPKPGAEEDPDKDRTKLATKKRLMEEALKAAEMLATRELELADRTAKHLYDKGIESGRLLSTAEIAELQRRVDVESNLRRGALDKWYGEEKAALEKALATTATLFGKSSVEYQTMKDKLVTLDLDYAKKREAVDEQITTFAKKEWDEQVKWHEKANAEVWASEKRMNEELARATKELADRRVKEILAEAKIREEIIKFDLDSQLKIDEESNKRLLMHHQETKAQWIQNERAALDRWYQANAEIMKRHMDSIKASYGEESSRYQQLVLEKMKLDQQYETRHSAIADQVQMTDKKMGDAAIGILGN